MVLTRLAFRVTKWEKETRGFLGAPNAAKVRKLQKQHLDMIDAVTFQMPLLNLMASVMVAAIPTSPQAPHCTAIDGLPLASEAFIL